MSHDDAPTPYIPEVAPLIDSDEDLRAILPLLARDTGPVAADTERASGFRYSQQAYLIQLATPLAGIHLIDPLGLSEGTWTQLAQVLNDRTWILHAATQDLPALRERGLNPARLFDTELAARLLGRERVGLGSLIEDVLGISLAKDHANSDWSMRPLPDSWLSYAAGDVEFLIELAEALRDELAQAGKLDWAEEEFAYLLGLPPVPPKPDPWRSITDIHLVRTRRGLATVRQLWMVREHLARETDLSPHRIVNSRVISAAASRVTEDSVAAARRMLARPDWSRRLTARQRSQLRQAVDLVGAMPDDDLPSLKTPRVGVPSSYLWRSKKPVAHRRWQAVRPAVVALAGELNLPVENLIAPKSLRALLWDLEDSNPASIDHDLAGLHVRSWQRSLVVPVIAEALAGADPKASSARGHAA